MKWKFWEKDLQTRIANELLEKDFLRTVKHYISFPNGSYPFSLAILPLHDGILTTLAREKFNTATDEMGRIIFTALDKSSQMIIDYESGLITIALGSELYDTYEIPKHPEKTDYHG